MLYSYNELLQTGITRNDISEKLKSKEIFKIRNGIYSSIKHPHELAVILKKYPNSVLTLDSAFFYYELTDKIPDCYYLATKKTLIKLILKK